MTRTSLATASRRWWVGIYFVIALWSFGPRSYAGEFAVLDGATVTWNPQVNNGVVTNYDQIIRVQDGAVDAKGTHVIVPGRLMALLPLGSPIPNVTQANFDTASVTPTSTSMRPSQSYYVYAATSNGLFLDYVISVVPP